MSEKSYAFLSALIPNEKKGEIEKYSRGNMQDAADALQWHLYNGLCVNLNAPIQLLNVLPVGSFPQYYKKPFINSFDFATEYCKNNKNIGFCNIKLIRRYIQQEKVYRVLKYWCKKNKGKKVLFVYTISEMFVTPIRKIKMKYPDIVVCAIIADLPDMTCLKEKKSLVHRFQEKKYAKQSYKGIGCIDSFVLLTKYMADYMKLDKPYCVVEGISTYLNESKNIENNNEEKIIMYTGTLHKRFGILNLLEAFQNISKQEYRLIICGTGDSEERIKTAAKEDKRIFFKGQLSRNEVLKLQQEATVLVNPRQNDEEFTKYSFPSKNLEYLSSGIPLVAYKLDGIPDDYDDYIYYVNGNSIDDLKNKLIEVCEMDIDVRKQKAKEAQQYVWDEKNEIKQTKIIVDMLKRGSMNG